jgi:DNA polymerase-3 subunit epsilon
MRQIILDTETTGLETALGHRLVEIGAVELEGRKRTGRRFHTYLNPERDVPQKATEVHGLTLEFLQTHPRFIEVAESFVEFVRGAQLVIHNASFDVGFINHELGRWNPDAGLVTDHCSILDTLALAKELHPGQRNSLDSLCKRYGIDNRHRELHGALLDAELLTDVYLAMTGGQGDLGLSAQSVKRPSHSVAMERGVARQIPLVRASDAELAAHELLLQRIKKQSKQPVLFETFNETGH